MCFTCFQIIYFLNKFSVGFLNCGILKGFGTVIRWIQKWEGQWERENLKKRKKVDSLEPLAGVSECLEFKMITLERAALSPGRAHRCIGGMNYNGSRLDMQMSIIKIIVTSLSGWEISCYQTPVLQKPPTSWRGKVKSRGQKLCLTLPQNHIYI